MQGGQGWPAVPEVAGMTQLTPSFVQLSRSAVLWGQYKPQNSSCPFGFLLSNSSGRKLRLAGRDLSHVKRLVHKDFSLMLKVKLIYGK